MNVLRQKHAVWLTAKLESDLEVFESALRKVGAGAHYLSNSSDAANRLQWSNAMYKTFANVMGTKGMGSNQWEGEELTEELAISMVIRRHRGILGTEELA